MRVPPDQSEQSRGRVDLSGMRRTFAVVVVLATVLVAVGSAAAPGTGRTVRASATFTVQLADQSGSYNFGQSKITKSRLDATPQVPVSLHAAPKAEPFEEFVLSGRVKKGTQETSEAVALGINVEVGNQSMLLNSTDGGCTVKVTTLTKSRVTGSFTCDSTYGGDPLTAKGTFKAR
jgi:hypothetical protein